MKLSKIITEAPKAPGKKEPRFPSGPTARNISARLKQLMHEFEPVLDDIKKNGTSNMLSIGNKIYTHMEEAQQRLLSLDFGEK